MWNYFSYSQSLRLIVYARKAKEVRDRELRLADSHWGTDLMSEGADEIKLDGEK
jgi:NADH dehydrogenase